MVLQIAPSGYGCHVAQLRDGSKPDTRARLNEVLQPEIKRVWETNIQVYGVPKASKQMNREGFAVARYTVDRLMKLQGLRWAIRGKRVRTTIPDMTSTRQQDRINQEFTADWPNQL
jgi:putative transposase